MHRTHFEDSESDHVVIVDSGIPADGFLIDESLADVGPRFSVSIASRIFFARSPNWLRLQEKLGRMRLDGADVGNRRTEAGYRDFTLYDVERVIYAFGENAVLTGAEMRNSLQVVRSIAGVHHLV